MCCRRYGHTCSARTEARSGFESECRLGTVNKILPVNRPPSDLLSGQSLDDDHVAAATRATPKCRGLDLVTSEGHRGLCCAGSQQGLTERQQLFPAPIREKAGKAYPDEPER